MLPIEAYQMGESVAYVRPGRQPTMEMKEDADRLNRRASSFFHQFFILSAKNSGYGIVTGNLPLIDLFMTVVMNFASSHST